MSAKYIADYFTGTVTPDYNASMGLNAQGTISEESSKSQVVHYGVDGSEERISFGTASIFYVTYRFNQLSESDSGTVFDFYNDPTKANGKQRSFEWSHVGDSHIYCVRFDCDLKRSGNSVSRYGYPDIRLKILGVAHA
jgi:hypothetical protein